MPQKDYGTRELDHREEIFRVIFPAHHDAAKIMKPSEQAFYFPAATVAAQNTPILRRHCHAHELVRRDEFDATSFVKTPCSRKSPWINYLHKRFAIKFNSFPITN